MHPKEREAQLIGQRTLAFWEIASVLTSCLIAEWVVLSFFGRNRTLVILPVLLALILMIVSHRTYDEDLRELGFRVDNFAPAGVTHGDCFSSHNRCCLVHARLSLCSAALETPILVDSPVGAVSAVRTSGLYQSPSSNRVRRGSN